MDQKKVYKTSVEWEGEPIVFKESGLEDLFAGETRLKEDLKTQLKEVLEREIKDSIKTSLKQMFALGFGIGLSVAAFVFMIISSCN